MSRVNEVDENDPQFLTTRNFDSKLKQGKSATSPI